MYKLFRDFQICAFSMESHTYYISAKIFAPTFNILN